jgi:hypothetical protein
VREHVRPIRHERREQCGVSELWVKPKIVAAEEVHDVIQVARTRTLPERA